MLIATERLILREFREDDWRAVLRYQSDPLYLRYYEWTERPPEAVREFVKVFLAQQREEPRARFQLAVCLKESGELIGNCGIRKKNAGAFEAELGYELAPLAWSHGYATEAARAMLRFAFTDLELHAVRATCIADNVASARVLEKLGMRREGRLRDKEYFKGRWWDVLLYALLSEEWREHAEGGGGRGVAKG